MTVDKSTDKSTVPIDKPWTDKSVPVAKPKADAPAARIVDADAPPPPVIAQLLPASAAVGDPSFALHILGSGFDGNSIIVFAGNDEPATQVSGTELTTVMNMPLWHGADNLSVQVRNADGQVSNTATFVLLPPREVPLGPADASKPTPAVNLI